MNRRTVLRSAGVAALTSLAGCVGAIESHFGAGELQSPVTIEVVNHGERPYNVVLEAYARGSDRQTYDHAFTITPDERALPSHLDGAEQRFRVTRFDTADDGDDLVETGAITTETQHVQIDVYDDDLELEISAREEAAENATDGSDDNGTENGT